VKKPFGFSPEFCILKHLIGKPHHKIGLRSVLLGLRWRKNQIKRSPQVNKWYPSSEIMLNFLNRASLQQSEENLSLFLRRLSYAWI